MLWRRPCPISGDRTKCALVRRGFAELPSIAPGQIPTLAAEKTAARIWQKCLNGASPLLR